MSREELRIYPVSSRRDLRKFVRFPFQLYRDDKQWVPPLIADDLKVLDPDRNPAFEFCRAKYWLAMRGERCVGRIAGIINSRDNERRSVRNARFGLIEFVDDARVCANLLSTAEAWATDEGMAKIEGPLSFTTFDKCAILIEGFDHLPTTISSYNFPYCARHIEACGYNKEIDYIEQRFPIPEALGSKIEQVAARALQGKNLRVLAPRTRKEILPYLHEVFELVNECYSDLYEFVPLTTRQIDFLAERYIGALDPNLVKIIIDANNSIVGAAVTFPSLSRGLQAARGRLFPLGFLRFLRAMKRNDTLDLYLIAVKSEMRNRGINAILMHEILKSVQRTKLRDVETNGQLETNTRVITMWKSLGVETHKRRRIYSKMLL